MRILSHYSRKSSKLFKLHVFCCGCVGKGVVRELGGGGGGGGSTGNSDKYLIEICFLKQ